MKNSKSIIHILLLITIQIAQFCRAQTCYNLNVTVTEKTSGFSCFLYQNERQTELVDIHDYLFQYITRVNTSSSGISFNGITDPNFEINVSNDGSDNAGTLFG